MIKEQRALSHLVLALAAAWAVWSWAPLAGVPAEGQYLAQLAVLLFPLLSWTALTTPRTAHQAGGVSSFEVGPFSWAPDLVVAFAHCASVAAVLAFEADSRRAIGWIAPQLVSFAVLACRPGVGLTWRALLPRALFLQTLLSLHLGSPRPLADRSWLEGLAVAGFCAVLLQLLPTPRRALALWLLPVLSGGFTPVAVLALVVAIACLRDDLPRLLTGAAGLVLGATLGALGLVPWSLIVLGLFVALAWRGSGRTFWGLLIVAGGTLAALVKTNGAFPVGRAIPLAPGLLPVPWAVVGFGIVALLVCYPFAVFDLVPRRNANAHSYGGPPATPRADTARALALAAFGLRFFPPAEVLPFAGVLLIWARPYGFSKPARERFVFVVAVGLAMLASYPWLRQPDLLLRLRELGFSNGVRGAALVLAVMALALTFERLRGESPEVGERRDGDSGATAVAGRLRTVAMFAGSALVLTALLLGSNQIRPSQIWSNQIFLGRGELSLQRWPPVVLTAARPSFQFELQNLDRGMRVLAAIDRGRLTLVVDSALANSGDLARGTPVARALLDGEQQAIFRAGYETAEWAARAVGAPAPEPWITFVEPGGKFFGQRYRSILPLRRPLPGASSDCSPPVRCELPRILTIEREPTLPATVELTLFSASLRP